MTTFRELLGSMIREYFSTPTSPEAVQMAHSWQRYTPAIPHNLSALPGYRPGQYARSYHKQLEQAIATALSPKPITQPLPARDIEYSNTSPRIEVAQIADIPTSKLNPLTPLPETRAELFNDVPSLEESLILWPGEEDKDVTEIRATTPRTPRIAAPTTQKIPTIGAEVILEHMAWPERVTGEQEPVKHWML